MRLLGVIAFLLAAVITAQETQFQEAVEVRLYNLDVVVTDREGRPVRNLSREDFVVTENGVPQHVTNFAVYDSSRTTATKPGEIAAEEEPAIPPRSLPVSWPWCGCCRRPRSS
ncbi:MAG TPA: hypothetical protein VHK90_01245 [Thermoanaerobaculia bacterium]|nr:hypothetical protein [Thermoanaerobaculia bacterium]